MGSVSKYHTVKSVTNVNNSVLVFDGYCQNGVYGGDINQIFGDYRVVWCSDTFFVTESIHLPFEQICYLDNSTNIVESMTTCDTKCIKWPRVYNIEQDYVGRIGFCDGDSQFDAWALLILPFLALIALLILACEPSSAGDQFSFQL